MFSSKKGALVLSPYRAKLKPPLEVVVMTSSFFLAKQTASKMRCDDFISIFS